LLRRDIGFSQLEICISAVVFMVAGGGFEPPTFGNVGVERGNDVVERAHQSNPAKIAFWILRSFI
jgi:hypothetical protein